MISGFIFHHLSPLLDIENLIKDETSTKPTQSIWKINKEFGSAFVFVFVSISPSSCRFPFDSIDYTETNLESSAKQWLLKTAESLKMEVYWNRYTEITF